MEIENGNNKRIVKNVFMLYIRMFLIMAVTLFTSRIILKNLGVEDFGFYGMSKSTVLKIINVLC